MADWLPGTREGQLNMAKVWLKVMVNKLTVWGIPRTDYDELAAAVSGAEPALIMALSADRTPVITAECQRVFGILLQKMRFLKDRFFKEPPLVAEDFISLLLNVPDHTKTIRGDPKAQKTAEFKRSGVNMLILKYQYAEGTEHLADSHTDIRTQVRYGLLPPPGVPPAGADLTKIPAGPVELPEVFDTARKTDIVNFPVGSSGKTAYFAFRIHNGKSGYGPWSPFISAIVP